MKFLTLREMLIIQAKRRKDDFRYLKDKMIQAQISTSCPGYTVCLRVGLFLDQGIYRRENFLNYKNFGFPLI